MKPLPQYSLKPGWKSGEKYEANKVPCLPYSTSLFQWADSLADSFPDREIPIINPPLRLTHNIPRAAGEMFKKGTSDL